MPLARGSPSLMDTEPTEDHPASPESPGEEPEVVVYWRPGCGFCSSLRGSLARAGLPTREVNIWDEPEGAAVVRRAANGNETVPTVAVAGQVLVNPSARAVVALAESTGITITPRERTSLRDRWRDR